MMAKAQEHMSGGHPKADLHGPPGGFRILTHGGSSEASLAPRKAAVGGLADDQKGTFCTASSKGFH